MAVKQRQSIGSKMRSISNGRDVNSYIKGSDVILPMDKQANLKQQFENNTTPLGASVTYTGASFDTMGDGSNYNLLTGLVRSDQTGTLRVEQSGDGTNWYLTDSIALASNTVSKINTDILVRYVRLVCVNNTVAQTSFVLLGYVTFKG